MWPLTRAELEAILRDLILDGRVECRVGSDGELRYYAIGYVPWPWLQIGGG